MSSFKSKNLAFQGSCPLCGAPFSENLGAVIDENVVQCANGHSIQLRDQNDSVRRSVRNVDREVAKLTRKIRRMGSRH